MSRYTSEDKLRLSEAILKEIESNSTNQACKACGVPLSTFMGWLNEDKELADKYARAKTIYPEKLVDEIMTLTKEKIALDDRGKTDSGRVQQIRVRVDAIKWIVSKLLPRKYGDRLTLAGDDEQPLTIVKIERTVVDPRKEEEENGK